MFSLLIAAAAAASSTSPTLEFTDRRINTNGVRATYTRSVDADGTIHLTGVYGPGRTRFHYRVKGDQVEGLADGVRVSFRRTGSR
jgi:hypothetical protein